LPFPDLYLSLAPCNMDALAGCPSAGRPVEVLSVDLGVPASGGARENDN
jgi:hypothetical protein